MAEPTPTPTPPARPALSDDKRRALALLNAGAIGGHLGALATCAFFFATRGMAGGLSCAVAAVVALLFYIVGQSVMVRTADAPPQRVLTASLISYVARVAGLGGLLALALSQRARIPQLDAQAVVAGLLAVVVSWLAAEVWAFSRMRFPVFDAPSPKRGTSAAGADGVLLESEPLDGRQGGEKRA